MDTTKMATDVKKDDCVMFKNHTCKITDISYSKRNNSYIMMGTEIMTGNKYELLYRSTDKVMIAI